MKRKYKWEEWFGQPSVTITRGVDYECSQSTMAAMIRNNASQRGLRIKLVDTGSSIIIGVVGEVQHTNKVAVTS